MVWIRIPYLDFETCSQRALRRERRVWVLLEGRLWRAPLVWETWLVLILKMASEDDRGEGDDGDGDDDVDDGDVDYGDVGDDDGTS